MDLIDLKGNTLKLYLVLATQRDQTGHCRLSQRRLSQQAGLARNTLTQALYQLERHHLVTTQEEGWTVDLAPLAALVGVPATTETGSKNEPPLPATGSEIEPLRLETGSKTEPPALSTDPRPRTLWSSSIEEDVLVKPQYSPPPGGAGGEEVPSEFLVEMGSVWKAIAPQEREAPGDWFRSLHREFGPQIPLLVFQQFAQSQRTLSHLRHPPSYKSYFTRCCHRAREEGANPSRPGRTAPAPSHALTAADYHLSDFFTPQPAQTWARAN